MLLSKLSHPKTLLPKIRYWEKKIEVLLFLITTIFFLHHISVNLTAFVPFYADSGHLRLTPNVVNNTYIPIIACSLTKDTTCYGVRKPISAYPRSFFPVLWNPCLVFPNIQPPSYWPCAHLFTEMITKRSNSRVIGRDPWGETTTVHILRNIMPIMEITQLEDVVKTFFLFSLFLMLSKIVILIFLLLN